MAHDAMAHDDAVAHDDRAARPGDWTGQGYAIDGAADAGTGPSGPGPDGSSDGSPFAPADRRRAGQPADPGALTPDRLLVRSRRPAPAQGWRGWVQRATGGLWSPPVPTAVVRHRAAQVRCTVPLTGSTRFVAVLSRKGGVGKTTTAALLGMTLAGLRADRIVALDANPDRGTLADRVPRQTPATVWDVVAGADRVGTFTDMSSLVSRDPTRLDVIASETDPRKARSFREADYQRVAGLLTRYYSLVITDCGTDFTHETIPAILAYADAVVVVAAASVDEATLAGETLDMIAALGYPDLVRQAIVVVQSVSQSPVNADRVAAHFRGRARAVVHVPRDPHLAEGSVIEPGRLAAATRRAAVELGAEVMSAVAGRAETRARSASGEDRR